MKRMYALAISLALVSTATLASAQQRPGEEIQAPRGQEIQAPRAQEIQAPRGEEIQAPRG